MPNHSPELLRSSGREPGEVSWNPDEQQSWEAARNSCPIPAPWKSPQGWQPPILSWECWGDGVKLGEKESGEVSCLKMEIFALRVSCAFVSGWKDGEQTDLPPGVSSQLFPTDSGIFGSPMCVKRRDHPARGAGVKLELTALSQSAQSDISEVFGRVPSVAVSPHCHLQLHPVSEDPAWGGGTGTEDTVNP